MEANIIRESQEGIISHFQLLGDWHERYRYLIDLGRSLMQQGEHLKTENYRFYGCQASVWLKVTYENNKIVFNGTSDSTIVAGLMALLFRVYSGRKPADIVSITPVFLTETGLLENLTSQRATGLQRILEQMQIIAQQYALQNNVETHG